MFKKLKLLFYKYNIIIIIMKVDEFLALSDEEKNKLKNLYLYNYMTIDLNFIFNEVILTNLEFLHLSGHNIIDISQLKNLTNLKYLYLENNKIIDITPLKNLTNLKDLYLENNKIIDITPLKNLTNLKKIYLNYNNITDITSLQYLTNLTDLYLYNNNISDITPLKNLTNLFYLDLRNNNITDINFIFNEVTLTNIKELDLSYNNITDINFIENKVTLTNCNITISYFPILYTKNPYHPLVMSYKMEEFDDNMKDQLITDLEVKLPFNENNISYV